MVLILPPNDVSCNKEDDYLSWLKEMSTLLGKKFSKLSSTQLGLKAL